MHWEAALRQIRNHPDLETQKPVIDLLHQEIRQGRLQDPLFLSGLETLYRELSSPGILSEIKRMQNRFRLRTVLGCDLLRMTSPPLGDPEKKQMWEDLHHLKSAYDGTAGTEDRGFREKFKVLNKIGDGGMSVVFKAVRRLDNKAVAIKFLREVFFSSPEIKERFSRECRMSLGFDHPHIIEVHETDTGEDAGYLVMEYLPLGGVDAALSDERLDLALALEIITQAAGALCYLHEKQIVHRDIKLSNLLISSWPDLPSPGQDPICIKLCDFGISKLMTQSGLTTLGSKMGTEFYTAPEQRETPEKADFRSDIYSLGVCLYRLISKRGFPEGDFPRVAQMYPGAPGCLDDVILKCLQHDPDKRFQTADEFLSQIKSLTASLKED